MLVEEYEHIVESEEDRLFVHLFGTNYGQLCPELQEWVRGRVIRNLWRQHDHWGIVLIAALLLPTQITIVPGDSTRGAGLFVEAEPGNVARGARVYVNKGSSSCHDAASPGNNVDLTQATERYSPITMTSALWRSGPAMLKAMQQKNMVWPTFRGTEMTDLIAYLNQKLVTRIGK